MSAERLTKRQLQGFINELAAFHWSDRVSCESGWAICQCEYARLLRRMQKVADRRPVRRFNDREEKKRDST